MKNLVVASLLALVMPLGSALAAAPVAQEGKDYIRLRQPQPVETTGNQIEVREFFWYGCPHCFSLEPLVERWLKRKPANAVFIRTPATFGQWVTHAQTFYAFEAIGALNRLHSAFFNALHKQNRKLNDQASIAAWVGEQGLSAEKFKEAFQSFGVKMKLEKTKKMINELSAAGLDGVPAFLVDGKYLVMTSGNADPLAIVDELVRKAAAERVTKKK
jgi:protein dithiol oxidoreductase (disulfide-forming)